MTTIVRSKRFLGVAVYAGVLAAGLLAAGGCDQGSNNNNPPPSSPNPAPNTGAAPSTNPSGPSTPERPVAGANTPGAPAPRDATLSPETRILSILHAKNLEEIDAGKLAQENGGPAVKKYGEVLVRDHTASDADVNQVTKDVGITLMSPEEVKNMLAREKGGTTAPAAPTADPLAELRTLKGAPFDSRFSEVMHAGHTELIRIVETAQSNVRDQKVKDLLTKIMPVLRDHEARAASVMNP